jgi:hypothetical protein
MLKAEYKITDFSGGGRDSVKRALKEIVLKDAVGSICLLCGETCETFDICHIHAKANGGSYDWANLFIGCATCNQSQGKTHLADFVTAKHFQAIAELAMLRASNEQKQKAMRLVASRMLDRDAKLARLENIRKYGMPESLAERLG